MISCPPWRNSHRPGEQLTEHAPGASVYAMVEGHGIHGMLGKGGDDSVMENPMAQVWGNRAWRPTRSTLPFRGQVGRLRDALGDSWPSWRWPPWPRRSSPRCARRSTTGNPLVDIVATTAAMRRLRHDRAEVHHGNHFLSAGRAMSATSGGGGVNVQARSRRPWMCSPTPFSTTRCDRSPRRWRRRKADDAVAHAIGFGRHVQHRHTVTRLGRHGRRTSRSLSQRGRYLACSRGTPSSKKPRQNLVAAGYCLYSSSCEFVVATVTTACRGASTSTA